MTFESGISQKYNQPHKQKMPTKMKYWGGKVTGGKVTGGNAFLLQRLCAVLFDSWAANCVS